MPDEVRDVVLSPENILLTPYLPRNLIIGLKKVKQLVPFNLEWMISKVAHYRIPRITFVVPETPQSNREEIDENCCFLQDFNQKADGILMNYEYEYIEVSNNPNFKSQMSQSCLGVFSLPRFL